MEVVWSERPASPGVGAQDAKRPVLARNDDTHPTDHSMFMRQRWSAESHLGEQVFDDHRLVGGGHDLAPLRLHQGREQLGVLRVVIHDQDPWLF